jgi:hypothetical protein
MGDLDIGLAMVAARIASSKMDRDGTVRKRRDAGALDQKPPESSSPTLSGMKMEVNKGKLILIPTVESARIRQARGWTPPREDGSVVFIDTGEIVQPHKRKEKLRSPREA